MYFYKIIHHFEYLAHSFMLHFITLLIIMYLGRNDTNHERSDFFLRKNTWLAFQFINFHKYN